MGKRILVVAAHPDDEILGCGGTLARHANSGDDVNILILGEGATSRYSGESEVERKNVQKLIDAANAASTVIGANSPQFGGFPDNRLDSIPLLDVIQRIEQMVQEVDPHIVYTHHGSDLNIDHQIACTAVLTACRSLPDSKIEAIYAFETPSSTECANPNSPGFQPNYFIDISNFQTIKNKALDAYAIEMRDFPHPRSIEAIMALAKWRGACVSRPAAEAYMTLRRIER